MKKLMAIIATAVALLSFSSCSLFYEESVDTIVNLEFEDENGEVIGLGLEKVLASYQKLIQTFNEEFTAAGAEELLYSDQFVLRAQSSKNKAEKNINKIAEKAAERLGTDFTCPIDGIFAIRMTYGSSSDPVTVWKHDYRPTN